MERPKVAEKSEIERLRGYESIACRRWEYFSDNCRSGVADNDRSPSFDWVPTFAALMDNAQWALVLINEDLSCLSAEQDLAPGSFERAKERMTQALRAATDVTAARTDVSALCECKQHPPKGFRIVVPIREIGRESAFHGLIVTEGSIEPFGDRETPSP
jgi:hypothetical protein